MGPIDYHSGIDLLVSILPNELSIFLSVKAFEHLYTLIPFLYAWKCSFAIIFFSRSFSF